jgi:signal transduction histidine kinase/ActR/RegA family two-component response regulator
MQTIVRVWAWLGDIGLAHATDGASQALLRLFNRIAFISALTVIIQSLSFLALGLNYVVLVNAGVTVAYLSLLVLTHYGSFLLARIFFLTIAAFAITHHHLYFGFASGFWILLLNLTQAAFVLYPQLRISRLLLLSAFIAATIVTIVLASLSFQPLYDKMTVEQAAKFMRGNLIRGPILLMLVAFYLVYENRRNEQALRFTANKATDAGNAKSFFLSNMSHELRTPMNAIKGFAEILLESTNGIADAKVREQFNAYLNQIRISSANLTSIIDDILDFARIETNRITLRRVDFNLAETVRNVMQTAQFYGHRNKDVEIQLEIAENVPARIAGDPSRLSQVLLNLAGNAMKFTHRGFVRLKTSLLEESPTAYCICFEVEDTGIGIPGEKLPFLFESFSQVSRETAVRYGGTGLGLAISRHLVEMQGGKISVMSSPGKGSVFTLTMWFGKPGEEPESLRKSGRDLRGARILVAEDNEVNQLLVRTLLESWNANVEIVDNGLNALGRAQKGGFDLILMDLQMPFMDGIEAAENIRSLDEPEKSQVAIIALTADVLSETRRRVLTAGMNDLVTKPINQAELYQTLRRALQIAE